MAGSYNHVVTNNGNLVDNERFVQMVENLGDAYEAVEEMYGMIWWLAHMAADSGPTPPGELVEMARQHYAVGLKLAESNPNKVKKNGR
jgi:hypothetical protein